MSTANTQPVGYAGTPGLFGIAFRNLVLTIVTLSIYRFWAKTRIRRYLWSQVTVASDRLEYTGTGKELFMGFLVVVAILTPFALILAAAQLLSQETPQSLALVQVIYFSAIVVLSVIALFRARRYRLSRTAWRGIYAGQDGSTIGYVVRWILWKALSVVTLGFASPWARTALQRYLMRHTRFGDTYFSFSGSGAPLFLRWIALVIVTLAPLAVFVALNRDFRLPPLSSVGVGQIGFLMVIAGNALSHKWLLLAVPLLGVGGWVWYRVRELRYFVACSSLGDSPLRSSAQARAIGAIYAVYGIVSFLLPTLLISAAGFLAYRLGLQVNVDPAATSLRAVVIAVFIVFVLVQNVVSSLWLQPRLLRHLCLTTTIGDLSVFERVRQSPAGRPRFGEGLADSFDI